MLRSLLSAPLLVWPLGSPAEAHLPSPVIAQEASTLVQLGVVAQSVQTADDNCGDHNTEELCRKATEWGLCKGWLHGSCLSPKATCSELRTVQQCHRAKEILGIPCRGWGGSSCLAKGNTCADITDETACVFGQASLGLQCKGWDGTRCLPLRDPKEVAEEQRLREERKARNALRAQQKEEAMKKVEKRQHQIQAQERRMMEEARKQQELNEEKKQAAKEAMRQRHQARIAEMKALEETKRKAQEEAEQKANEEAQRMAAEEVRQVAEQQKAENERLQQQQEEDRKRREAFEEERRSKFGEELFLHVVSENGKEAVMKLRSATKLKVMMNLARTRLGLPAGQGNFTFDGREVSPNDTPSTLGLQDQAVIKVVGPPAP